MSWWKAILAWLSNLLGQRQGRADQRAADIAATNQTAQEITHAEASAPADRTALVGRLRADPDA